MVSSISQALPQVITEIQAGDCLGIAAAGKLFPPAPGRDPSTIWRWMQTGARAADGSKVRLERAKIGGRWCTSRAAVERFLIALNQPASDEQPVRTPTERQRESEAAGRELERMGG